MKPNSLLIFIAIAAASGADPKQIDMTCIKFADKPELSKLNSEAEVKELLAKTHKEGACTSLYTDYIELDVALMDEYSARTIPLNGMPGTLLAKRTADGKLKFGADFDASCAYRIACTSRRVVENHSAKRPQPKGKGAEL